MFFWPFFNLLQGCFRLYKKRIYEGKLTLIPISLNSGIFALLHEKGQKVYQCYVSPMLAAKLAGDLSFPEFARDKPRALASGSHPGRHETLQLGQAGAGRPDQVYRVDKRQPAPAARVPGVAKR